MGRKETSRPPLANLTHEEMKNAIPKLESGIKALKEFNINQVNTGRDVPLKALSIKINTIITDIFDNSTHEYFEYHSYADLQYISLTIGHDPKIKTIVKDKINAAIAALEAVLQCFIEKLESMGRSSLGVKALKAYSGLELHPDIAKASTLLFRDGHYSNAIEDAVKALNKFVSIKSGISEDGVSLMQKAFSPSNPLLQLNTLEDKSDLEEQKGLMYLFMGAVSGLRNPRAHKIIQDDPEMTLEYIAFISLLAKLAAKATVNESKERLGVV